MSNPKRQEMRVRGLPVVSLDGDYTGEALSDQPYTNIGVIGLAAGQSTTPAFIATHHSFARQRGVL